MANFPSHNATIAVACIALTMLWAVGLLLAFVPTLLKWSPSRCIRILLSSHSFLNFHRIPMLLNLNLCVFRGSFRGVILLLVLQRAQNTAPATRNDGVTSSCLQQNLYRATRLERFPHSPTSTKPAHLVETSHTNAASRRQLEMQFPLSQQRLTLPTDPWQTPIPLSQQRRLRISRTVAPAQKITPLDTSACYAHHFTRICHSCFHPKPPPKASPTARELAVRRRRPDDVTARAGPAPNPPNHKRGTPRHAPGKNAFYSRKNIAIRPSPEDRERTNCSQAHRHGRRP